MLFVIQWSLVSQICPNILVTTCMKCKNEENYQLMGIAEYDIYLYTTNSIILHHDKCLMTAKFLNHVCNQDTSLYNNNVRIVCLVKRR